MTQVYENLAHLPKVPTVPSSNSIHLKPESSSFNTDWSSFNTNSQAFQSQALLDFAQHGHQAYAPREALYPPIGDIRRSQLIRSTQVSNEEYNAQASNLFREFLGCQGFHNYRTRRKKSKTDSVWPDYLEFAFFNALVRYPPCGRQQFSDPSINGGKKMGRNELIGHYIKVATGIERGRKQVSSHLQVIRPYVVDKPTLLASLISQKELSKWNRSQRQKGKPTGVLSSQRISSYIEPVVGSLADFNTQMHGLSFEDNRSHGFTLHEFEMSLCPHKNPTAPLHIYSCTRPDSRLPDVKIDNYRTAYELFPELFQNRFPRPVGSSMLVVEASFSLPRLLKTSGRNELVIYLNLIGPSLPGTPVVDTITTFFSGPNAKETQQHFSGRVTNSACPTGSLSYQIPFCSSYWASLLARLGISHALIQNQTCSASEAGQIRTQIDTELRSLTALQQIAISSPLAPDVKHHITLRWQFRLSSNNATGSAGNLSWRQVGIPPIINELPSPSEEGGAAGSFSSQERESEPGTPPEIIMHGREADVGLRSPITLRGEGWEDLGKTGHGHLDFGVGEGMGLDMSFLPEGNFGVGGIEQGSFNFADFDYGGVAGHVDSQQTVVDPNLAEDDWHVVEQSVGLGLDVGETQERKEYNWMMDLGVSGHGIGQ
ncbi:TEA/ATTS domain-containing protein [Elsinoe fawcettii]|nr:TEA/ATTS domain-containing protein [Elsinoe fawcettii]